MMGRSSSLPPAAPQAPPAGSGAEVGTERGIPAAGPAHLRAELLVLLLQALQFLLQGVVLEVLLQGRRRVLPAQPGDGREGTECLQRAQDGAANPAPSPLPPEPTRVCSHPALRGCTHGREGSASPAATPGTVTAPAPRLCLTPRSSPAPGERWDRDPPLTALRWWRQARSPLSRWCRSGAGRPAWRPRGAAARSERERDIRAWPRGPQPPLSCAQRGKARTLHPGAVTSSLANSSCSSRSSLRSVRLRFCFSRDCPMRAASSRSRSFCKGQVCISRDPAPALPPFPSPPTPTCSRGPTGPQPLCQQAPAYLIQQVGDSIDVVIGLCDPDHPLSTQDWGRRAKGEPPHCGSTGSGAQHHPLLPPAPCRCFPTATPRAAGWREREVAAAAGGTKLLHAGHQKGLSSAWQHPPWGRAEVGRDAHSHDGITEMG